MIAFDHIHKRYGSTVAIHDLSLTVEPGETLALVGPNGAGKTTLMRRLSADILSRYTRKMKDDPGMIQGFRTRPAYSPMT